VSAIRINTHLHPQTVSIYLKRLDTQGLIDVKITGWKKGKHKPCFITNAGITWLIDTSLDGTLQVLSDIMRQLKGTESREIFQKVNEERYSRNRKIIGNYFVERLLKGDKSPIEYPEGLDLTDPDQPFREALKKLLALHLYLISNPLGMSEDPERSIENDFILFAPHMTFMFSWHPRAFPELEHQIRQVDNYFRSESERLNERNGNTGILKETHLLGLDRVDEKYFDEYLKANDKASREIIMEKIEHDAGWSVSLYLGKLLVGKETEIEKYVDGQKRPSLRKFISLFENCRSK
jgi:hypothetical protein